MNELIEWAQMDGHGVYIWSVYAMAMTVFFYNLISPKLSKREFFRRQTRNLKREAQRASDS